MAGSGRLLPPPDSHLWGRGQQYSRECLIGGLHSKLRHFRMRRTASVRECVRPEWGRGRAGRALLHPSAIPPSYLRPIDLRLTIGRLGRRLGPGPAPCLALRRLSTVPSGRIPLPGRQRRATWFVHGAHSPCCVQCSAVDGTWRWGRMPAGLSPRVAGRGRRGAVRGSTTITSTTSAELRAERDASDASDATPEPSRTRGQRARLRGYAATLGLKARLRRLRRPLAERRDG